VGNVLLSDDGAGVHAAERLTERLGHRDNVQVLDAGTLSFSLAPLIETADRLIVIDAAELHQAPGTVECFLDAAVDRFLSRAQLSVHEIGLRDLMDVARLMGNLPARRAFIAIQPESLEWGPAPTPTVAASLNQAVTLALLLLDEWPDEQDENTARLPRIEAPPPTRKAEALAGEPS
jgi:hydrogenase maturation protease